MANRRELQRRAMLTVPLSAETVLSFYDGSRSGTAEECFRALCESHERLRMESEGAQTLLVEEQQRIEQLKENVQSEVYLRGNQLAAISTVLYANTPITLLQVRLPTDHALYTAAFQDAVTAIEREIRLHQQTLQQRGVINILADRLARYTGTTAPDEIRKAREACIEQQANAETAKEGQGAD